MATAFGADDPFVIEQRRAQENLQQAQESKQYRPPKGPGMVSGIYVKTHPLQYLAEMLRSYTGGQREREAQAQLEDIGTRRNKAMADTLRGYTEKMTGAPEKRDISFADPDMMGPQQAVTPAVAPDPRAAYASLISSPFAQLQQVGMTGMAEIPKMEAAQAERQEIRDERKAEAERARQAKIESDERQFARDKELREMTIAGQRQMAQLSASLRPERNVTVMGPNGEAITMPQSQAQGMQAYNPQAAAQLQKSKTKNEAKEQLSGVVQQLNNSYNALEKGGGITSTNQGALGNIGARIGSSSVGQVLGGALGTENQRQRQEIEQTRPLLLNLIKEATGMSAQQMNSNAEMQLYLKAATDPTLTVEANRSALANLDKMFGLGLAKRPEEAGANRQGARSPQDQQALQWAQQNPNDPRSSEILKRLGGR